ncbi:hypothetical protein ACEN9F_03430 [Duganella sp. CT11-25]|uniref:hypothetical protein n=1 Tax=unclassified Duganella TaxID=2636909 RepID=UPI0039AFFFE6
MILDIFPFLRFHFLRLFAAQPLALLALSLAAFAVIVTSIVYWHEASLIAAENDGLAELRGQAKLNGANRNRIASIAFVAPSLPWFQGTDLAAQLSRIADNASLPVDEVSYSLDEGANQPYMRYHVTMTVTATYPAVRRFVRDVTAILHNVDLDAISCKRSDINIAPLSCDLAFSAFFRKEAHG